MYKVGQHFNHIGPIERDIIAKSRAQGWSFRAIGESLGRSPSSISREYARHLNDEGEYLPSEAQAKAEARNSQSVSGRSKCEPYRKDIYQLLCIGWTPEQIAGWLSRVKPHFSVSHEAVYQFIYRYNMMWTQLLPRKHAPRWHRGMKKSGAGREMIPNRISILERSVLIDEKLEFGHWEGDSIVCSQSKESLNVMVERQTQYVSIRRVFNRGADATKIAMIESLRRFKKTGRKSITLDNGIEFKRHEDVKKALKIDTYFCQPYHSWEKGLVEQVNGLIRRFLPKKTDISKVTDKEIRLIEYLLNSRPRKLLNWATPAEIFAKKCRMKLVNGAVAT